MQRSPDTDLPELSPRIVSVPHHLVFLTRAIDSAAHEPRHLGRTKHGLHGQQWPNRAWIAKSPEPQCGYDRNLASGRVRTRQYLGLPTSTSSRSVTRWIPTIPYIDTERIALQHPPCLPHAQETCLSHNVPPSPHVRRRVSQSITK